MNRPPGLCDGDDDEQIKEKLGPPPGMETQFQNKKLNNNIASLESLKLGLKLQPKDIQYDQIPLNGEYMEPSMNNLMICNGFLGDTSGSDVFGLWNHEMQLQRQYKGLVENMPQLMVSVGDQIFMNFADMLFAVDLTKGIRTILLELPLQAFCVSDHTNPRVVGISDGILYLWKTKLNIESNTPNPKFNLFAPTQTDQHIEQLMKLTTPFEDCDDLIMLGNGIVFCKQNKVGELFIVNFQNDRLEECQQTQGCPVTCWTAVNYDTMAFGGRGQIIIVQYSNSQGLTKIILEGQKEEIYHGLCVCSNTLFSITKNANIISWNQNNGKKLQQVELNFTEGVYDILTMNKDHIVATHQQNKDFLILSNKLEKKFFYHATVKQVTNCAVSPCGQYIAIVQKHGLYYDEQINFHPEIEVFPFNDTQTKIQSKKEVENIETHTVQFVNDAPIIQFITKTTKSVNPMLISWNFLTQEIKEIELLVEQYKTCQLYPNKMAFSYSFLQIVQQQQQFNLFAPVKKPDASQTLSGVSVYDNSSQKRLLKVQFQQQFDAEVFGMPNDHLLFILNSKNQIEIWDVNSQSLAQKADCRPSVVKAIKFSGQYLLLIAQNEWIIRDTNLGLVCKTKGAMVQKAIFIGKLCILKVGTSLTVWDLQVNQVRALSVPFSVSDFCVIQGKVLAIGDSAMKLLII